jgi:hypothetical protein
MAAFGALQRRFSTLMDVPTIPAFPVFRNCLFENPAPFKDVKQLPIPPFMICLRLCDLTECPGNLGKSLFLGNISKSGVQGTPFHLLTIGGRFQVLGCRPYDSFRIGGSNLCVTAFQEGKKKFRMLFFILRCFRKDRGYLFKSFLFCSS